MEQEQVTHQEISPEETDVYDEPRGAFRFVVLMFIGYFIYFFVTWIEVVLGRGS